MSILMRPYSYQELELEREGTLNRLELIEGEIYVTPAPSPFHQRVSGRLYSLFDRLLPEQVFYAPVDVFLAEYSVVQPDLIVVLRRHMSIVTTPGIEGAPDLVVEILSPTSRVRDRAMKRDLYARYGIPEFWLVDPDAKHTVIFSNPVNGRYLNEHAADEIAVSATIPGLSANLAELFAPIGRR